MDKYDSIRQRYGRRIARYDLLALTIVSAIFTITHIFSLDAPPGLHAHLNRSNVLAQCTALKLPAGPSPDFHKRASSDRFVSGTRPTLIQNASIWTGAKGGTEIVEGDILLDRGIVKAVGDIPASLLGNDVEVINAGRSWLTPGLGETVFPWIIARLIRFSVDPHSHIGVFSVPVLNGVDNLQIKTRIFNLTNRRT